MPKSLTKEQVNELLSYDPDTGVFRWKVDRTRGVKSGDVAGSYCKGYRHVTLLGSIYYLHRLAFLLMTGAVPTGMVDHINGVKDDNRWSNLRDVTNQVNMENQRRARKGNSLGVLGVSPSPAHGKFRARIIVKGKYVHLGTFDTVSQAQAAYLVAKRKLHEGNTL